MAKFRSFAWSIVSDEDEDWEEKLTAEEKVGALVHALKEYVKAAQQQH